jgi:hypothetical protein
MLLLPFCIHKPSGISILNPRIYFIWILCHIVLSTNSQFYFYLSQSFSSPHPSFTFFPFFVSFLHQIGPSERPLVVKSEQHKEKKVFKHQSTYSMNLLRAFAVVIIKVSTELVKYGCHFILHSIYAAFCALFLQAAKFEMRFDKLTPYK